MNGQSLHAKNRLRASVRGAFALALSLCGAAASPVSAAEVRDVRVGRHPTFTRVVFEFDERAGYKIERGADGKSVVVKLEASAASRNVSSKAELVRNVEVEPSGNRAVARIHVVKPGLSIKEMILPSPPRVVLDFLMPEAAEGLARTVDSAKSPKSKAAAAPKAKPVVAQKPKTEPTKPVATKTETLAKAETAAKTEPPKQPEKTAATPAAVHAPKTEVATATQTEAKRTPVEQAEKAAPNATGAHAAGDEKSAHASASEPAPQKSAEDKSDQPITLNNKTLEERGELTKPEADLEEFKRTVTEGPLVDTEPEDVPASAPEAPAEEPEAPALAEKTEPAPAPPRPSEATPAEKPAREVAAKTDKATEAPATESAEVDGEDLPWFPIAAGAGALALVGVVAFAFMRRRSLPNDDDLIPPITFEPDPDDEIARESSYETLPEAAEEDAAPVAADQQFPFGGEGFAASGDSESEREAMSPATSLFDDEDEKRDLPMEQMEAPLGGGMRSAAPRMASVGGDSDLARVVAELERRLSQAEQRMQEQAETIERLDRQVAAQNEELRVQRAAIARTQRALRSMSRSEEEQATEPALRDPR
jgi:uncharacterized coiled-coil protein SlyX